MKRAALTPVVAAICAAICVSFSVDQAFAQDSALAQLRTAPALNLRDTRSRSSSSTLFTSSLDLSDADLASDLDAGEIDGDSSRSGREARFRSYFWATRNELEASHGDEGLREEGVMGQVAKQLTLYQSALLFSSWARQSAMAEEYRFASRALKRFHNATRVSVVRAGDGSLALSRGGSRLLEFKIHASPRSGVSPILQLSEHVMLRYGIGEGETLLEYELNF